MSDSNDLLRSATNTVTFEPRVTLPTPTQKKLNELLNTSLPKKPVIAKDFTKISSLPHTLVIESEPNMTVSVTQADGIPLKDASGSDLILEIATDNHGQAFVALPANIDRSYTQI